MFIFNNHEFHLCITTAVSNDYICNKCNIRVHNPEKHELRLVIDFVNDDSPGNISMDEYLLTCEEQIIKNLLE